MTFTIGLTSNFNDTDVEPVRLACGQVTLQISPINFFSLASLAWRVKKYESFLKRVQQNNKKAFFTIVLL